MTVRDPVAEIASHLSPEAHSARLALFVSLGDSFTAGTGVAPGRAWPELLTSALQAHHPAINLTNLAVEGATSDEVAQQLPEAIELEPDLVTVVCGANDVLRHTRPDPMRYAANLALVLGRLRLSVPGVRIATATSPEQWDFLALGPRTRRRIEQGISDCNKVTRRLASALDVPFLEVAGHPGLSHPENFSDDGLHPSAQGHERAAAGFARLLHDRFGIETGATT